MASTLTLLRSTDAQWPAGRVVPLDVDGLGFWSVRGALLTRALTSAEVFLRIVADGGGFRAEPGRGGFSMHVNGVRGASNHLVHGDVIGVDRFVFRYQTHEWPGPFDAAREATLTETLALGAPVRALRHLEWLQPPQVRGADLEDKVGATLRDLAAIGQPPSLETLSLGLTTHWEGLVDDASLSLVRATFPRWSTTPASVLTTQRRPGEARLELISPVPVLRGADATQPLVIKEGESFSVRLLANGEVLVRRGPPQLREDAVRIGLGHDGCRVLAPINRPRVSLPRLAGRQLAFFHLAPGDVVELVPGLRARFVRE